MTASMSFIVLPNDNMFMVYLKTVLDLEAQIKAFNNNHILQIVSEVQT